MAEGMTIAQFGLSIAAGSLTTLSPCVFPLLPLVVGGITQASRLAPMAMGAGMAASFSGIGLLLGLAGSVIGIQAESIRFFGGALLILFSLVMLVPRLNAGFTNWMSPLSTGASGVAARVNSQSLAGAFVLGGLLGLIWSPCSGPLLASALTLVATEGGVVQGGIILGAFGVGAAIPLVAVAYASRAGFSRVKEKVLARIEAFKQLFAVLIGLTGMAIVTGWDKRLEALITNYLPDWWVDLTIMI